MPLNCLCFFFAWPINTNTTIQQVSHIAMILFFNRPIKELIVSIERFSFECRKVIGFAISTLRDWLKKLAPLFHPIQSEVKPKPIATLSHAFSRALRQLHVITSSFDWFTVLSVFFVIG